MEDSIQTDLAAWTSRADQRAGRRAVSAVMAEWRPRVAVFLGQPAPDRVDEELQAALVALCVPGSVPPRALAPPDVTNPRAWRLRVLKNHLVDRARRQGRRTHAERAAGAGHAPQVEAELWRSRRTAAAGHPLPVLAEPAAPVAEDLVYWSEARARVVAALPGLPPRRAMIAALALGVDPLPLCPGLARELDEPVEQVATRARAASSTPIPPGEAREGPSDPMVRVIYPLEPLEKARESARKALARALADLRARVGGAG